MTDIKTPEERSKNMAKIRSKDTKPEIWFRKKMFQLGYRYRKNVNYIPGKPDIWMAKYNTAIFIHGCFWHRHNGCKYAYIPKTRIDFWQEKFKKNIKRDLIVRQELQALSIKQLIIWECSIKSLQRDEIYKDEVFNRIKKFLNSDDLFMEI